MQFKSQVNILMDRYDVWCARLQESENVPRFNYTGQKKKNYDTNLEQKSLL